MRELREEAGLTQAQLAERIGVGHRQVANVERGDIDSSTIGSRSPDGLPPRSWHTAPRLGCSVSVTMPHSTPARPPRAVTVQVTGEYLSRHVAGHCAAVTR